MAQQGSGRNVQRTVDTATTGMPRHPGTSSCGRCVCGCDADKGRKRSRGNHSDSVGRRAVKRPCSCAKQNGFSAENWGPCSQVAAHPGGQLSTRLVEGIATAANELMESPNSAQEEARNRGLPFFVSARTNKSLSDIIIIGAQAVPCLCSHCFFELPGALNLLVCAPGTTNTAASPRVVLLMSPITNVTLPFHACCHFSRVSRRLCRCCYWPFIVLFLESTFIFCTRVS
jgi:hypothetical protein